MSERIYQRFRKKTVFAGTAVIAAAFLCYGFENVTVSVVAFSAAGFFNSVLYPVQSDSLNQLIPSGQRATLISVNSLFFSVAMILMFPLAGMLADHLGLMHVFEYIGAAVMVFACVCSWSMCKTYR